jgi:hypothetical protein
MRRYHCSFICWQAFHHRLDISTKHLYLSNERGTISIIISGVFRVGLSKPGSDVIGIDYSILEALPRMRVKCAMIMSSVVIVLLVVVIIVIVMLVVLLVVVIVMIIVIVVLLVVVIVSS